MRREAVCWAVVFEDASLELRPPPPPSQVAPGQVVDGSVSPSGPVTETTQGGATVCKSLRPTPEPPHGTCTPGGHGSGAAALCLACCILSNLDPTRFAVPIASCCKLPLAWMISTS